MSGRQLISFLWRPVLISSSFLALFIVVTHFDASSSSSSSYTEDRQIVRCGTCICLIALFWCTEVLPLEVTSLLPLVLLPLLGILRTGEVAREYFSGANMLLLAAMGVAGAAKNVGLHRRLALRVLLLAGTGRKSLLLAFMLVTTALSMFICNTATCAMIVPILSVVLDQLYTEKGLTRQKMVFYLAVAYCANIGGTGTVTAEETNLILMEILDTFPSEQHDLSYATWLFYAVPLILVILVLSYCWLLLLATCGDSKEEEREKSSTVKRFLKSEYKELGPLSFREACVALYFLLLVLIWFFAEPSFMTGWSEYFKLPDGHGSVSEATPAILVLILIMMTPQHLQFWPLRGNLKGTDQPQLPPTLMSWSDLSRFVPWGLLILRGAGFALAKASDQSGLSDWIGEQMTSLSSLSNWQILTIILLLTSTLNEVVNNATTASILLPVMKDIAVKLGVNPLYLLLPVTLSCNYTFMLPASCPPNAIVYKASGMRIHQMVMAGLGMKIITLAASLLAANTWGSPILGMDQFPDWANSTDTLI